MKIFKLFAAIALGLCSAPQISATGFLRADGHDIVTPNGEKFYIQGTNLGNWLNPEGYMFGFRKVNSPRMINDAICQLVGPDAAAEFWKEFKDNYITRDDIQYIASLGANTIRAPFHYKLFTDEDYMGLTSAQDGFARIDKLVEWCRECGLYLILDMHDAPGGQTGDNIDDSYGYPWLMVSEESQHQFCNIWREIALHYKDEPVILGYELINEPVATYFTDEQDKLNSALVDLLKKGLATVREVDTNHIVLLGSPQWNSNFTPFENVDFGDENIVFTCHRYGGDPTEAAIRSYIDFRDASDKPMYMGEIGHNTDQWQSDFVAVMKKNNIGYTFWPYKKCDGSCMVGFNLPENWNVVVDFTEALRGSYSEIRENMPDRTVVRTALAQIVENVRFANCNPQESYIKSMALTD